MQKQNNQTASESDFACDPGLQFSKKTLQDYEVISVIGNGSFGTCFKVRDKETGNFFAWKGIDYDELSESKKESLVSEINVLRQLQHPNIVQYYHHLINHEAKSIFIVMECCEGGDLAQLILRARSQRKRFEEKYIWRVLFQVCKAVQVCHNKIKNGTILHRDIKPANIFLDAAGNAKLGDFGLARMLRRHENFADSFVGTPYYMSPEIVKGSTYDRKSDVWAVGCLAYEMCALRPPFKGNEFSELSANISNGKFKDIPNVFSADVQEIIAFMLEIDSDQRPSIEIVTRHPIVIRNIINLGNEFPKLLDCEEEYFLENDKEVRCKLKYNSSIDLSSLTEQNSFNEQYGQRRLCVSGVFTPDLKAELFYSAKRKVFSKSTLQYSDSELYETVQNNKVEPLQNTANKKNQISPRWITQDVFNQALEKRLHAIRLRESLLKEKEACLLTREQELIAKEKRLLQFELSLSDRAKQLEATNQQSSKSKGSSDSAENRCSCGVDGRGKIQINSRLPPPVPPRKPVMKSHDDTYCSIDTNDSPPHQPTIAKLDMAALPAAKSFPTLRRVTFQSPKKFITYDIENVQPNAMQQQQLKVVAKNVIRSNAPNGQMQGSLTSKSSDESTEPTKHRRKSILSIFGLNRGSSNTNKSAPSNASTTIAPPKPNADAPQNALTNLPSEERILAKCEASDLSSIWTKEHKRAAFDMLAAMNAASQEQEQEQIETRQLQTNSMRPKLRHSVRERSALNRTRLRRSLGVTSSLHFSTHSKNSEKIIV